MRKIALFQIIALVFCLSVGGVAFASGPTPATGGFKGPGPARTTVAEAIKLRDDSPVTLQGHIIERLGDERYTFKDATGTVVIEIDDEDWGGLEVTPAMAVIIEGEVEKSWSTVEIEVDRISLAK